MSEIRWKIYTNEDVTTQETDNERTRSNKPSRGKPSTKRARPSNGGKSKPKRGTNKPRAKK